MDNGRPVKPFFIEVQNFWACTDKLVRYILGHLGYFRPNNQHPFGYRESHVHVFHYSTIISTKNQAFISTLQIFIWDWDLNLGPKALVI